MCRAVNLGIGRARIGDHFRGIEHAKAKTRCEQSLQRSVDILLADQALFDRVEKLNVIGIIRALGKKVGALVVHTRLKRQGTGFRQTLRVVMSIEDVVYCIAV